MKSLTILLISTFLISLIFSCSNGKSDIEFTINAMQESIPKLVEEIKNMKECNTSELKPICSKGYRYWNSQSEAQYFKGVSQDYENIRNFLAVILDYLPIEKKDAENVGDLMALSISADALAVDIMGLDVIYNRNNVANAANKGCYFTFLLEKSCEHSNEYDFLFTMINFLIILFMDIKGIVILELLQFSISLKFTSSFSNFILISSIFCLI